MPLSHAKTTKSSDKAKIRQLNDIHRKNIPFTQMLLSVMVSKLPSKELNQILEAVIQFNDFNKNNDPHREHDFGTVTVKEKRYFWKIDYYDNNLQYLSPAPEDPTKTKRVITIMCHDEY